MKLLPFKKGAFHVALASKAPIIPVVIKEYDFLDYRLVRIFLPRFFFFHSACRNILFLLMIKIIWYTSQNSLTNSCIFYNLC
jgi:1-acyl-sn-glycerol-3-phosphate acyltransferase